MEWFRHDINAHDDIKLKKLIKKYGFAAVGMYWFLIELIYCAGGRLDRSEAIDEVSLVDGLTEEDAEVSIEELISVGLIFADGTKLGSHRTDSEILFDSTRRKRFSDMGKASAEARLKVNTGSTDVERTLNTLPNHTLPNITPLVSKDTIPPKGGSVSKKQVIPSFDDVANYCKERGNGIDPQAFIDYYASQNWKKANGRPLYDWKAGVRTWENKRKEASTPKQRSNKMVEDLEERIRLNRSIDPRTGEPR